MDKQNSHHSHMTWFIGNVAESQSTAVCPAQRHLRGTLGGKQNACWRSAVLRTHQTPDLCVSDTAGQALL